MFESVLSETALRALAVLGTSGTVSQAYLAGGSALALYFGHRISVDFDFFTPESFDPIAQSHAFEAIGEFKTDIAKGISLVGEFNGIKLSYFKYDYPLVSKTSKYKEVAIADPKDIAAMKLVAICDRSTKKDYIDLYVLSKKLFPLEDMFEFYDQKYQILKSNIFTVIRSMSYFEEADQTEMPQMLIDLTWDQVKQFFETEAVRLGHKYLEE